MIRPSSIPSRTSEAVVRIIGDECLLIPLAGNIADMDSIYRLNVTGVRTWELIDGARDVSTIAGIISDEFDVTPGEALKDITVFLGEITALITVTEP